MSGATVHVAKEMVTTPSRRIGRLPVTIRVPHELSEDDRRRLENAAWRQAVQTGLVPVSVGLVAASAAIIATTVDRDWIFIALTAAVAGIALGSKIHPLWLLAAGAAIGWTGFGQ